MRILNLAICVLAALATCGLSHEANATSSFNKLSPDSAILKGGALGNKISAEDTSIGAAPKLYSQAEETKPVPSGAPASELAQPTSFSDIQGNWARSFIEALTARDIIQGFPNGTFRPDEPVTRAQFAAMISKAFPKNAVRPALAFVDVSANYWAGQAIQEAHQTGFLEGYPNNVFIPNQNMPRVQVLVSLANGLDLATTQGDAADVLLNAAFQDVAQIPEFARTPLAAATANRLVVNYPNVGLLNPNQVATRADVAAFIYQALASTGEVPQISATDVAAEYIVGYEPVAAAPVPRSPEKTPSPQVPQQEANLRQQFQVQFPEVQVLRPAVRVRGGSSINSPTAFGADGGRNFVGASFQARTRYGPKPDGVIAAGFGLGNARKAVGLEVVATSVDVIGETAQDGTVSFKVHRLLPNNFAVALGVENAIIWGNTDGGSSIYGVASKVFSLREDPAKPFGRITASLGLGSDRFRSEEDQSNGVDTFNVFGSVGLQVFEQMSLIADWSGQDLYLGASIVPFRQFPLVIVPGIADVTGSSYGDGGRFILGVGYGFSF